MLHIIGSAENDLVRALSRSRQVFQRWDRFGEAWEHLPDQAGVIVLADRYPTPTVDITTEQNEALKGKDLRLFVEFPAGIAGVRSASPHPMQWERAVVTTESLAPDLPRGRILSLHQAWRFDPPTAVDEVWLAVARVAGYRQAVFGVPDAAEPLLYRTGRCLVATSQLSQWVTSRYFPILDWSRLWQRILQWATAMDQPMPLDSGLPSVHPRFQAVDHLPDDAESTARKLSAQWLQQYMLGRVDRRRVVIEGYQSEIDLQGRQSSRIWIRADCQAEVAMSLAHTAALDQDVAGFQVAKELLDGIWFAPEFVETDLRQPEAGLVNWYERGPIFYGDGNARTILASLALSRHFSLERWDTPILRAVFANFRTTGSLGFRHSYLTSSQLAEAPEGWRTFAQEPLEAPSPHFQAYLWAAFLWAYHLTGFTPLLEAVTTAVSRTMAVYPWWSWTNGWPQELARMLLPLTWLAVIEDTAKHRQWLDRVRQDLLSCQVASGAIRERLGPPDLGRYPPPASNAQYGTTEAALIQTDGDPLADLLYTVNFALLSLYESARWFPDAQTEAAIERLADFLVRVQAVSTVHPYLHGAWLRGFDDDLWEFGGSSSDAGWGAWCVESGWTNTWIPTVMAFRATASGLWMNEPGFPWAKLGQKLASEMGLVP